MELLAPAGSQESFYAALEAGADAVYLGLDAFNARLRAKNFTTKTLAYLLPWAHSRGKRVYVALNTLVKQAELPRLLDTLYQLEQLGIDALIVADLGVAALAREHFPRLVLHGSTQMFFHNSLAPATARRLGLSRIILARELSLKEIAAISRSARGVELEVFVHGALCYSFSGLCLASSYSSGTSGNRGRCAQLCRRSFTEERSGSQGAFFSTPDFRALDHLPALGQLGVSCLKIEGRMKNPAYVHTVVSAYRLALDNKDSAAQAAALLDKDMGRHPSSFFLTPPTAPLINLQGPVGTGTLLGTVATVDNSTIGVLTHRSVQSGDRLRIDPLDGESGTRVKVSAVALQEGAVQLTLENTPAVSVGDRVYVVEHQEQRYSPKRPDTSGVKPRRFNERWDGAPKLLARLSAPPPRTQPPREELYVRIDNPDWLPLLDAYDSITTCIARFEPAQWDALLEKGLPRAPKRQLWGALPLFIEEGALGQWRQRIGLVGALGVSGWACTHLSQRSLFDASTTLAADWPVWSLNRAAQQTILQQGFSLFCHSPEDDTLNLRQTAHPQGLLSLYAPIPLFISRIPPATTENVLIDSTAQQCRRIEQGGVHLLVAQRPLCLFHQRAKLRSQGFSRFVIDLSFTTPNEQHLGEIMRGWEQQSRVVDSGIFNYKAELR